MNLLQHLRRPTAEVQRAGVEAYGFGGVQYYGIPGPLTQREERVDAGFAGLVEGAYRRNGVVFACELARMMLFTEARFAFQRLRNGRPGDLWSNGDLRILEKPWAGGTTGDLLARKLLHADFAGSAFTTQRPSGLKVMRPDWVTIVMGSYDDPQVTAEDLDAELLGYIYHPGGMYGTRSPVPLLADEVAHFAPVPDPLACYRGMSWLTPLIREIEADSAATSHKLSFFRNGAAVQTVVSFDKDVPMESVMAFKARMEASHQGSDKAYKTLYLGGGADVTLVGKDLQQLDFKVTQGAGETRVAAAAGMHPVIVGLSEGLSGSSLNAGNFNSARRLTADKTLRPLWRNVAGSLATLVPPPSDSRLWYDTRDIAFLREDQKDAADIAFTKAQTIRQYIEAGYDPSSAVAAVANDDETLLVHSGLVSVQLQPPGGPAGVPEDVQAARAIAEMVQKVYLGVGVVLSEEEARALLNKAGAGLRPSVSLNGSQPAPVGGG